MEKMDVESRTEKLAKFQHGALSCCGVMWDILHVRLRDSGSIRSVGAQS